MIVDLTGRVCQHEDCDGRPATCVAVGRDYFSHKGHPEIGVYCDVHAMVVADEGSPEYVESCPNCGCRFGVN